MEGNVFAFTSPNSLRKWLKRQVARVRLPAGSSIVPAAWQCHNLRASRVTSLAEDGMRLDQIRLVTGHRKLENLQKYIKTDEATMQAELMTHNARRDVPAARKRDAKAATKARAASLLDLSAKTKGQHVFSKQLVGAYQKTGEMVKALGVWEK